MNKRLLYFIIILLCVSNVINAQAPKKPTSADIYDGIKKLQVLGSVLYLAAHPDDENTRLIAYMANERRLNTAYLSLTRGDGGQNLIGPEIRELLGVIRTQELLGARRIDGGQQMFTRANDFGYSKHPDETLRIWNRDEVLADVVWAIRKFQPDIIVNRFDHESAGRTHGHHTSSAILSYEAFDLVNDPKVYPEQLKYVDTWQPRRLFFNTSWWFYGSRENFAKADKSRMLSIDVGTYYPLKGKSNTEIASLSRSMHRCQGFGSTGTRGNLQEYIRLLKGDMPSDKEDPMQGIDLTWNRVKGGAPIGQLLAAVEKNFKYEDPAASIPDLVKAYKMIEALPEGKWRRIKSEEIKNIIQQAAGLFIEVVADNNSATPGEQVELTLEMINRSDANIQMDKITYHPMKMDTTLELMLDNNQVYKINKRLQLPTSIKTTNPYWLNKKGSLGMYTVEDQLMRGKPETPRAFKVTFDLMVNETPITYTRDVIYKKNDPVMGELYQPFEITPPVFANIENPVYVFADDQPKEVEVVLVAGKGNLKGKLELCHPNGWKVEPVSTDFELAFKGQEKKVKFTLYPSKDQSESFVGPLVRIDSNVYDKELIQIKYDHIPTQTVFQQSEAKVVRIDLKKAGQKVGYIMGAGDEISGSLEQIGYDVTMIDEKNIAADYMAQFDAVIVGIRAFNTVERLKFANQELFEYSKNGGTVIVQYNTNRRLKSSDVAPYPLKISRGRVSVEEAPIRMLQPDHQVLNFPNKITQKDFDGWVQERGLYFPNEWDEQFEAILSSNDPGEDPLDGGLLVAKHGEGYYIYTGYSWFRELPAGVPGAYRLFTNLISIGKESQRP